MAQRPNHRQAADGESAHDVEDEPAVSEAHAPALPAAKAPPADDTLEYTELVLLVHAGNPAEAELYKAELEAHGIPALLQGEGAGVAGIPDVGAGVPILVPEELANQAAELIAELESARPEGCDVEYDTILGEREGDLEDIDEEDIDALDSLDKDLDDEDDDDWDDDDEDDDEDDWDDDDEDDWDDDDEDDWDDDDEDDDEDHEEGDEEEDF